MLYTVLRHTELHRLGLDRGIVSMASFVLVRLLVRSQLYVNVNIDQMQPKEM
jgi:hypothetical protein